MSSCSHAIHVGSSRLTCHIGDALEYVNTRAATATTTATATSTATSPSYDVIMLDISGSGDHAHSFPPPSFLTPSYLRSLSSLLTPAGLLLINFGYRDTHQHTHHLYTLTSQFEHVYALQGEETELNRAIACMQPRHGTVEKQMAEINITAKDSNATATATSAAPASTSTSAASTPIELSVLESRVLTPARVASLPGASTPPFSWDTDDMDLSALLSRIELVRQKEEGIELLRLATGASSTTTRTAAEKARAKRQRQKQNAKAKK